MPVIYLISGPIQAGKTTQLQQWCAGRPHVAGLLSPVLNGKRFFIDIQTGRQKPMEVEPTETDIQQVGRFTFSGETFAWANEVLSEAANNPETKWLVIDEIGPLELQGKGLAPALETIFSSPRPELNMVLVIREGLVSNVLEHFNLDPSEVKPFTFS